MRKLITLLALCVLLVGLAPVRSQDIIVVRKRAAVAASGPDSITGLELWLKADSLSLSDGDPVSTWTDSSGNGNDGTQVTVFRPSYQTNEINGLPALLFDPSSQPQHIILPNFASGFTAGDIFIVIKINNDPPSSFGRSGIWKFGTSSAGDLFPYNANGLLYLAFGTDTRKSTGVDPTPSLAAWRVFEVRSAANDYEAYLDGTSIYTTGTNTVAFHTAPLLGYHDNETVALDGYIAEVIFYDKSLSAPERTTVKAYLAAKYALTLA